MKTYSIVVFFIVEITNLLAPFSVQAIYQLELVIRIVPFLTKQYAGLVYTEGRETDTYHKSCAKRLNIFVSKREILDIAWCE